MQDSLDHSLILKIYLKENIIQIAHFSKIKLGLKLASTSGIDVMINFALIKRNNDVKK